MGFKDEVEGRSSDFSVSMFMGSSVCKGDDEIFTTLCFFGSSV